VLPDVLSPIQQYRKLITDKTLRGDDHQTRIIHKLQDLHDQLKTYNPPIIPDSSLQHSIVRPISPNLSSTAKPTHPDIPPLLACAPPSPNRPLPYSARALPLRRRRHRQDNANGLILPDPSRLADAQTPCPFPRLHDRRT
jgi:hypothetical protein